MADTVAAEAVHGKEDVRRALEALRSRQRESLLRDASAYRGPVFILSTARSGSTLLRLALNAHPLIAAPAETDMGRAIAALRSMWSAVGEDATPASGGVRHGIRQAVVEPLHLYMTEQAKQIWCDKSLCNIEVADEIVDLFPNARFICLYRHAMDVIASGTGACRWGYQGYGFEPYVRSNPTNIVEALGVYWWERTASMFQFETQHMARCVRVYYETLVNFPAETLAGLCRFLGVPYDSRMVAAEAITGGSIGPGDHKVLYGSGITNESVGLGSAVPVRLLGVRLREGISEALKELAYPPLDDSWNERPHPLRISRSPSTARRQHYLAWRLLGSLSSHRGLWEVLQTSVAVVRPQQELRAVRFWLEDATDSGPLDVAVVGGRVVECSEPPYYVVLARPQALCRVATGELNLGELVRHGEVRVSMPGRQATAVEVHPLIVFLRDVLMVVANNDRAAELATGRSEHPKGRRDVYV